MQGPQEWVGRADRARKLACVLLGAFSIAKVILWVSPYPAVSPPLDFVEMALPAVGWISLWAALGLVCLMGIVSQVAWKIGVSGTGTLLAVWGLSYAIGAVSDPQLASPALMHFILSGLCFVMGSFSSLLPSNMSKL